MSDIECEILCPQCGETVWIIERKPTGSAGCYQNVTKATGKGCEAKNVTRCFDKDVNFSRKVKASG